MKNAYLKKRQELQDKAQALIDDNKAQEAEKVMDEIKNLDKSFEAQAKAQANLNVLNRNTVIDIENAGVALAGAKVIDKTGVENIENEAEIYKNAFAKTLMGEVLNNKEQEAFNRLNNPEKTTNELQVQTTKTDAIVVPETMQDEIFKEMGKTHSILNDIFNFNIKGELSILVEKPNANNTNDLWVDEEDESNDSKESNLAKVTLSGCELSKGVTISWKLKSMSIDKFLAYIVEKISEKMGDALAYAIINGKGKAGADDNHKSQPLGIITALEAESNKPQVIYFNEDDDLEAVIRKVISKINGGYSKEACIYANYKFIWETLAGIKDKTGRAYFVPDYNSGGVGRIFGVLVKQEDAVSDEAMIYGAVNRCYAFNVNEAMSITQEDDNRKRTTFYGGYMLCDGTPKTTKGFSALIKSKKA